MRRFAVWFTGLYSEGNVSWLSRYSWRAALLAAGTVVNSAPSRSENSSPDFRTRYATNAITIINSTVPMAMMATAYVGNDAPVDSVVSVVSATQVVFFRSSGHTPLTQYSM
jgi:hypothetical protein